MLAITGLRHIYSGAGLEARTVLDIGSWSLDAGTQALLRGVSGSGKTTLFNIIAGMLRPTEGTVHISQQDVYALSEAARDRLRAARVGYIFQTHQLMPGFSALENLLMPMQFGAVIPPGDRKARARSLLQAVGLAEFGNHRPHQLSAGQRLRIAVARALVNHPKLVLADEPTAALDPANADRVMAFIQDTCHQDGAALIVASHDPALSTRFSMHVDLQAGLLSHASAVPDAIGAIS